MAKSIVFFGTPDFAVASLEELHSAGFEIKALVTAPDRPAGRGYELKKSDCKILAEKLNLPVLQPEKLKARDFIEQLQALNADLFVVVAFRMLPKLVWEMPKFGTMNLHASLLPQYRGAAPINWAIINGEETTGLSCFLIEEEIDTGSILSQKEVAIDYHENFGSLYDRMKTLGAQFLKESLNDLFEGNLKAKSQKDTQGIQLKPAPKIFKQDCKIDWSKSAQEVYNFIRGLSPYPAAFTEISIDDAKTERLKLFETSITDKSVLEPNTIIIDEEKMLIPSSDFYLSIQNLQRAGKKAMPIRDFIAGHNSQSKWRIA